MKPFEHFIEMGEVRKVTNDTILAKSLVKDMISRIDKSLLLDIQEFSKMVFENMYDALRDFADALLAADGFKSYSHQASFAYLAKYGFDEPSLDILDKFRYKRNSSKYYGQDISEAEANEICGFYNRIKSKINSILKSKDLMI